LHILSVFVALVMQSAMSMRHMILSSVVCPVLLSYIFPYYLKTARICY